MNGLDSKNSKGCKRTWRKVKGKEKCTTLLQKEVSDEDRRPGKMCSHDLFSFINLKAS